MKKHSLLFLAHLFIMPLYAVNAGVIPYAKHKGHILLLLGEDQHRKGVWTDFGGTSNMLEKPWQTAAREFLEESLSFFKKWDITKQTPVITNISHTYYAYCVSVLYAAPEVIKNHTAQAKHPEKIDFVWVLLDEVIKELQNQPYKTHVMITVRQGTSRTPKGEKIKLYHKFVETLRHGLKALERIQ